MARRRARSRSGRRSAARTPRGRPSAPGPRSCSQVELAGHQCAEHAATPVGRQHPDPADARRRHRAARARSGRRSTPCAMPTSSSPSYAPMSRPRLEHGAPARAISAGSVVAERVRVDVDEGRPGRRRRGRGPARAVGGGAAAHAPGAYQSRFGRSHRNRSGRTVRLRDSPATCVALRHGRYCRRHGSHASTPPARLRRRGRWRALDLAPPAPAALGRLRAGRAQPVRRRARRAVRRQPHAGSRCRAWPWWCSSAASCSRCAACCSCWTWSSALSCWPRSLQAPAPRVSPGAVLVVAATAAIVHSAGAHPVAGSACRARAATRCSWTCATG